jgi:hypothetical protein
MVIDSDTKLNGRALAVGKKIEPRMDFLQAKKYRKSQNFRTEGYYWVKMPDNDGRPIPNDPVHEGWEPAYWGRRQWHLLGKIRPFNEEDLEAGHQIIPKIEHLLEIMNELLEKGIDIQEKGLKKLKKIGRKKSQKRKR